MPMFRIRSLSLSVAALLATAILSGCSVDTPIAKEEGSTKPVPVKTVSVMLEQVQKSTTQPATVHAYYRAEIRAKVLEARGVTSSAEAPEDEPAPENDPAATDE